MSERKNVQTEHKWVAKLPGPGTLYLTYRFGASAYGDTDPKTATLYDSPSDVPDDCTPVRVRVETWEEQGEPEEWDFGDRKPDGYRKCYVDANGGLWESEEIVTPEVVKQWLKNVPQDDIHTARTAIPVHIPTETKRKVTLDPEPEEKWDPEIERSPGDWRPIETAPRPGGESVLVFSEGFRVHVAHRCATATDPNKWADHDGYLPVKPTHWMPLPEPPGVKKDPEPTETGCRCREALERVLTALRLASDRHDEDRDTLGFFDPEISTAEAALANCDCKARETVQ